MKPAFASCRRGTEAVVSTVLMEIKTLNRFRHLAVDGALPQRARVPLLTAEEHRLYQHLVDYATTREVGLLLEQERIPWQHAYPILGAAIAALANPVPTFARLSRSSCRSLIRSGETKGRPDVPVQCEGRRHAEAHRRPPHRPERHRVGSGVTR